LSSAGRPAGRGPLPGAVPPDVVLPVGFARALEAEPEPTAGEESPLTEDELYFAERARAANTRRAYWSDLTDFARWCKVGGRSSLPAAADTVSGT
jgi:hypothetical protein